MKKYTSLDALLEALPLKDGMRLSFHHHLRNGDGIINPILTKIDALGYKDIHLSPSAIFPSYTSIETLLKKEKVASITTNYLNGPVANYLALHGSETCLKMQTHGGRARAIIEGENSIDIAFIAAPTVDKTGAASGLYGPSACGSLGYAMEDVAHAKLKIFVTDHFVDAIENPQIHHQHIDYLLILDSIGDARGIVSGTTTITRDPIGVSIARRAAQLIEDLDIIKPGFSFQSGAGGVSLRVTDYIKAYMQRNAIKAKFFSGGITKYHVEMLEMGLVEKLYDVQCFDLEAIKSLKRNATHHAISAHDYANPNNPRRIIKDLDVVILGATEIDLDFNVNVTTDSFNTIIGGSGGHSDTASDAFVSIIVTPLLKARTSVIKTRVNTITTLGKHVDCLVTERGIAINPRRKDLIAQLKNSRLDIVSIDTLMQRATAYTGHPKETTHKGKKIGVVEDRDGTIIDTLHAKE